MTSAHYDLFNQFTKTLGQCIGASCIPTADMRDYDATSATGLGEAGSMKDTAF